MLGLRLDQLVALLDLETLEQNWFRGTSSQDGRDRIFGGQVMAQALVAAYRTVEERLAHSFHGYFLRPGNPRKSILYEVDRIRDGRSFTTRRVVAIQDGEAIFNLSVSFQTEDGGLEHQIDASLPPAPSGPRFEDEVRAEVTQHVRSVDRDDRRFDLPIEVRTVDGLHMFDDAICEPRTRTWIRAKGRLPDHEPLHQAVLAYASDLTLMVSAVHPHPIGLHTPGLRTASLDHAMWFHRRFRADEWIFFDQESPVSARSRGFGRGTFYTGDGRLVASCTQEGLMRYRPPEN